jgi:hypothetical protein
VQSDAFGTFAVQVGQLSFDINHQQLSRVAASKAIGEQGQK